MATGSRENLTPTKAQRKLSLNQQQSDDVLVEGNLETYDFLLLFVGGVVHVNPLTVVRCLLIETGTFPAICVRNTRTVRMLA